MTCLDSQTLSTKKAKLDAIIARWRAEYRERLRPPITAHRAQGGLFYAESSDSSGSGDTIWLYDVIGQDMFGGISAQSFARVWETVRNAKRITIRINSPGGDVFDGAAIASLISEERSRVTVIVDGLAASIASLIAVTADKRIMHRNAMWMVHDPWGVVIGTADDMRGVAEALDKIGEQMVRTYAEATGQSQKYWREAMHAERWFDAREALENGLVEGYVEEQPQDSLRHDMAARLSQLKQAIART